MSKWNEEIINTIKLIESESYVKGYSTGYQQAINDFMKANYLKVINKDMEEENPNGTN